MGCRMLRRRKGYILLALLVLTGLAGSVKPAATTVKERKTVVKALKESRDNLFAQVGKLNIEQLTYKPSIDKPSIAELLQIQLFKNTMSAGTATCNIYENPVDAEPGDAVNTIASYKVVKALEVPQYTTPHASLLINHFKHIRKEVITYARTTTEDLKNNYVATGDGDITAYNCFLLLGQQTEIIAAHIGDIKNNSSFPD
jgi:hypothetical protein